MKRLIIVLFLLVSIVALSQQGFEMEPEPIKVKDTIAVFNHQLSAGIGLHSSFSKDHYEPPADYYPQDIDYSEPHGGYYLIEKTRPIVGISHTIISKWGISFKSEVNYFNHVFVRQSNIDSINKYVPDSSNTFLISKYASNHIELRISLGFCYKKFRGFVGLKTVFMGFPYRYEEDRYGKTFKRVTVEFAEWPYLFTTARIYYVFNYKRKFQLPVFIGIDRYDNRTYRFLFGIEMTFFNK